MQGRHVRSEHQISAWRLSGSCRWLSISIPAGSRLASGSGVIAIQPLEHRFDKDYQEHHAATHCSQECPGKSA